MSDRRCRSCGRSQARAHSRGSSGHGPAAIGAKGDAVVAADQDVELRAALDDVPIKGGCFMATSGPRSGNFPCCESEIWHLM